MYTPAQPCFHSCTKYLRCFGKATLFNCGSLRDFHIIIYCKIGDLDVMLISCYLGRCVMLYFILPSLSYINVSLSSLITLVEQKRASAILSYLDINSPIIETPCRRVEQYRVLPPSDPNDRTTLPTTTITSTFMYSHH